MNILITGCKGQLGHELMDIQEAWNEHTFFNTDYEELDITNEQAVKSFIKDNKIDGVINCAAYTAVDKAESDTEKAYLLNQDGPKNLAEAIEANNGWMIHISTDYVFDGESNTPYNEESVENPMNVYGRSKCAGEAYVMDCCSRAIIIRTAWLYSEYGNNFVKTMIKHGQKNASLKVVFDQIGTPTYAFDLAITIMNIVSSDKGIVPGIYHYTNEGVASWYDFAKEIMDLTHIDCVVKPIYSSEYPTAAHRPNYSVLDKTKIKQTYGIEIPHWRDSLKDCIQAMYNMDKDSIKLFFNEIYK